MFKDEELLVLKYTFPQNDKNIIPGSRVGQAVY